MNILRIDTSDNLKTIVEVEIYGEKFKLVEKRKSPSGQKVLDLIERLLKKQDLKLNDLSSIEVNTGPGSYTGIRVGVAIANALSFSLGIPVNKKKLSEIAVPEY